MNRYVSLTFVILVILTISLTVPHSFLPLGVEGQTINNTENNNSLNVVDLVNSNTLTSNIQVQNKTVDYFDNTFGYLVYPTMSSIDNNKS